MLLSAGYLPFRRLPQLLRLGAATLAVLGAMLVTSTAEAACVPPTACLEATFPGDYVWGSLDAGSIGNVSADQVIAVTSTDSWGVTIAVDLADGRMKEWSAGAYVSAAPRSLTHPLTWKLSRIASTASTSASYTTLSSTPTAVVSAQPSTCTATCASVDVVVSYRQAISYADVSAGTNDYRIGVGYEAAQGF